MAETHSARMMDIEERNRMVQAKLRAQKEAAGIYAEEIRAEEEAADAAELLEIIVEEYCAIHPELMARRRAALEVNSPLASEICDADLF